MHAHAWIIYLCTEVIHMHVCVHRCVRIRARIQHEFAQAGPTIGTDPEPQGTEGRRQDTQHN